MPSRPHAFTISGMATDPFATEHAALLAHATTLVDDLNGAADVVATGSARGMATFSRPLTWSEMTDLEALGATIHSVELVSEELEDGLRWTFIGPYSANTPQLMEALAPEDEITMLGVVAAEVTVPDAAALVRLTAEPSVLVIDLSPAYVGRLAADYEDILVNDLYWHLAGWLE